MDERDTVGSVSRREAPPLRSLADIGARRPSRPSPGIPGTAMTSPVPSGGARG